MAQSLEQYVAEATNAYAPATTAVQGQLDALAGQLATAEQKINKNYAQQQASLNRQRNMAAETASMQAAGSGGSFGGAANIANRKFYDQSFVPAQTQMQTNQANELATARQDNENQRTNLNSQMAGLQAQANQQALAQYYADREAEANRQAQIKAAQSAAYYQYLMNAQNTKDRYLDEKKNMYGGYDWLDTDGNKYTAGQMAQYLGGDFNESLYKVLAEAADNRGDLYSQWMAEELRNGARFAQNDARNTGDVYLDTLGVIRI